MSSARKLHRWTDLLAALLVRRFPVSLELLRNDVPAYGAQSSKAALRRMFERDKDELRSFGVPIETITDPDGESGYLLRREHFYLPYLSVAGAPGPGPKRVDRDGFRSLARLAFEPDELAAIGQAAKRVAALGEANLSMHAESAVRKLSVDLPVGTAAAEEPEHFVNGGAVDAAVFEMLDQALTRRKRVTFDYFSMTSGTRTRRTTEPFGLFFLGSHWYLAAREPGDAAVRNFRLSRITAVAAGTARPGQPDYEVPPEFQLREHARSRQAWELGDGDGIIAEVAFGSDGGAAAAARLGTPVEGDPARRRFRVRRTGPFVRWLLSLGTSALPVAPPSLVDEYRAALDATLAVYAEVPE